jgi:hypothetical protein
VKTFLCRGDTECLGDARRVSLGIVSPPRNFVKVEPFLTQGVRAMSSPADLIAARIRRLERVISELRDLHQEVEAEDARIQGQ